MCKYDVIHKPEVHNVSQRRQRIGFQRPTYLLAHWSCYATSFSSRRPTTGRLGTRHLATRLIRDRLIRTTSIALESAPIRSSLATTSFCPLLAARWSGVRRFCHTRPQQRSVNALQQFTTPPPLLTCPTRCYLPPGRADIPAFTPAKLVLD